MVEKVLEIGWKKLLLILGEDVKIKGEKVLY